LRLKSVTIEDVARYPLVTYDDRYNSGWVVQREFQRHGLAPRIAARATDATVIKANVAAGLGVAVLQKMAFEPSRDVDLKIVPTGPMFPSSMAAFTLRKDQFLRDYARDFIGITAPQWSRKALERALAR